LVPRGVVSAAALVDLVWSGARAAHRHASQLSLL